jgi:hypothetical protein
MMTTNEIVKKYGKPNETGEGYLTTILITLSYEIGVGCRHKGY